ncbi:acyl-protein thioesterase 1-like protein [Sarcoptes scabiei]|uniref:palmitoyl-protein hydrolase n=1 Tax=Sarcoptes scabiei TaxID=52283 RepID=A0A132ADI5_SARSC|nr:acyl-protein thioesterase 1-like protein [Sarcoptes scabiei]
MSRNVVISATGKQTASIIFLHGLGDTGNGWASVINSMKPAHAKLICPTANTIPVTLNSGFPMPSWFDLYSLSSSGPVDEAGIEKAKTVIHKLIDDEEKAGIPSNRILLGGFSQGGALALYSGLTYPKPLAGIMALSCWIPLHEKIQVSSANASIPTFQLHGDSDQIVSCNYKINHLSD